ncbi:DUF456 domain-containing protein [Capnocytophaga felis]|uniref:Membrane protein n=1 Tax=Capnocytophaga felis TaxID=2267611 RepID=A0A5M4BBX1_9FLAO|nr:DUF456 domain-containing protein [Capnocytophaga felis]GET46745.1 membrane protein [Capnocytophaga felis]GET48445.1 membrane protein [Capnocytophaga felis]
MEIIVTILSILVIIVGILGTIIPMLPGLVLCLAGLFAYKFFGNGAELPNIYLWIFSILTIVSLVLEYIIPVQLNKKYGGTNWGSAGGIVGMLIGFFIPIPLGFLIGMLVGVFIGELLHDSQDTSKAFKSMKGSIIGFFYSTGFNFLIGVGMLFTILIDLIAKLF